MPSPDVSWDDSFAHYKDNPRSHKRVALLAISSFDKAIPQLHAFAFAPSNPDATLAEPEWVTLHASMEDLVVEPPRSSGLCSRAPVQGRNQLFEMMVQTAVEQYLTVPREQAELWANLKLNTATEQQMLLPDYSLLIDSHLNLGIQTWQVKLAHTLHAFAFATDGSLAEPELQLFDSNLNLSIQTKLAHTLHAFAFAKPERRQLHSEIMKDLVFDLPIIAMELHSAELRWPPMAPQRQPSGLCSRAPVQGRNQLFEMVVQTAVEQYLTVPREQQWCWLEQQLSVPREQQWWWLEQQLSGPWEPPEQQLLKVFPTQVAVKEPCIAMKQHLCWLEQQLAVPWEPPHLKWFPFATMNQQWGWLEQHLAVPWEPPDLRQLLNLFPIQLFQPIAFDAGVQRCQQIAFDVGVQRWNTLASSNCSSERKQLRPQDKKTMPPGLPIVALVLSSTWESAELRWPPMAPQRQSAGLGSRAPVQGRNKRW